MFNRSKKASSQFDWPLFITTVLLCLYGLFVLRSATAKEGLGLISIRKQALSTLLGFGFIALFQLIDMDQMKKLAIPLYLICLAFLVAVLFFGHGKESWGANSWLNLKFINFQPSEISKIGVILFAAFLLDKYQSRLSRPLTLLFILFLLAVPLGLILKQPDLGTSLVYVFFLAVMFFYAGLHWGYFLAAILSFVAIAPVLYSRLDDFQKKRILNFLHPSETITASNYQYMQGIIAVGSGKLTGRGYMQGPQSQLGFIPVQDNDFIFAVLAEEFGFIGGAILIILYGVLLYRIILVARQAKDTFESSLCMGFAGLLFFHIFENIGMTIGLMPVTGIPLPFMSNGGTFQLISLIGIAMVLSVSTQRKPLDFNAD